MLVDGVRIVGPPACAAAGPPPVFVIDAAGLTLFMVELAAARHLMTSTADRTPDNYFYGGDADGGFATGLDWGVPPHAWARLGRAAVLYYRVVAFDQAAGVSALSVDDRSLHLLPALVVEPD